MYVNAEGLAAYHLGMYAGRIGQPVVGMDDVELLLAGYYTSNDGEVVDLFVQVARIATGKLHATQVVDVHIGEVCINMVAEGVILFGRGVLGKA